jgi:hypothetical protein
MKANRGEAKAEDAAKIVSRFAEVSQIAIRLLDIAKAYRDWEIALGTDVELWSGEDGGTPHLALASGGDKLKATRDPSDASRGGGKNQSAAGIGINGNSESIQ